MIAGYNGKITMYNSDTHYFIPPDPNETYDWPVDKIVDGNKLIDNWNTWMRAVIYWLRDKFDFTISSGPGTSVGKIGRLYGEYMGQYGGLPDIIYSQYDNDWTSSDLGRVAVHNSQWEEFRAPSPFRPYEENGEYYYTAEDSMVWNAQWQGSEKFDDHNNRFDIILEHPDFNNLGLRFKYPLTTTNTRGYENQPSCNGTRCEIYIVPACLPVLNKQQIAFLDNCNGTLSTPSGEIYGNFSNSGFIKFLTNSVLNAYTCQYYHAYNSTNAIKADGKYNYGDGTTPGEPNYWHAYQYHYLNYSEGSTTTPYPWTPDYLEHVDSKSKLFSTAGLPYNTIYYKKTPDNKTLYIAIGSEQYGKILEFVIYKNLDNTSGLLLPDRRYNRGSSYYWNSSNGVSYQNYTTSSSNTRSYGNIGGIVVSSNSGQNFTNFIVTPTKYYKDIRDTDYSLVDNTGLWRLENLCPIPNSETSCESLYLVTRCGTPEEITWEGKKIVGSLNGISTKFLVFPFNGTAIGENNFNDCSTLFAIPIEQEQEE